MLVLPDEPVTPTTVRSVAASITARASRPKRALHVGTTTQGRPATAASVSAATAPRAAASATKSWPSTLLADAGDEQAARAGSAASR